MAINMECMTQHFPKSQAETATRWPRLHRALQVGVFSYIDLALAEKLLCRDQNSLEESAAFICHLSRSTREGHLCVKVEGSQVTPSPFDGGTTEVPELIELNLSQGAAMLPLFLVTEVNRLDGPLPSTPICRCGQRYYFQKYWLSESLFLKNFDRIRFSDPTLPICVNKNQMEGLNAEQMLAIQRFSEKSLTLICGGPGTGKTYIAGRLIKIFWDFLDADQRKHCKIALAAPTGKAAANLQKSLQSAIGLLEKFPLIQAKTLHALLGMHRSKKLSADLILIDESSMIDVRLMAQFMASVKTGARVILIGDPFQLPPVEVGSVFADIVNSQHPLLSQNLVELTTCLRTEQQDLITFAKAVQEGHVEKVFHLLDSSAEIEFLREEKDVFHRALSSFPHPKFCHQNPKEMILGKYDHFRLLSSFRKGPFGVDEMNQRLLHRMKMRVKQNEWFMAPIMITSNNDRMELFNGEVGVLVCCPFSEQTKDGDYALFPKHSDEGVRKIPACLLPKYEYAYCLSVHKSQGSEFDRVLLLMPEGTEFFGRESLYTAVTRARKKLEIWGSHSTIAKTLQQFSLRQSGVSHHNDPKKATIHPNMKNPC